MSVMVANVDLDVWVSIKEGEMDSKGEGMGKTGGKVLAREKGVGTSDKEVGWLGKEDEW